MHYITWKNLKVCSVSACVQNWSTIARYEELLICFNLPTLKQRRKLLKFCFFFLFRNESYFFPNAPVADSPVNPRLRSFNPSHFSEPTAHTVAYVSSFFPGVIKLWNKLPLVISSASSLSLSLFKRYISLKLPTLFNINTRLLLWLIYYVNTWLVLSFATGTALHSLQNRKQTSCRKITLLLLQITYHRISIIPIQLGYL